MGNFVSCVLPTTTGRKQWGAARVVFPGGEVRTFVGPTKAAELMLETPNHFLVNYRSVQAGRRFVAMSADEDLEESQAYVMFPMKRLNSVVTAGDMGPLFLVAAKKRGSGAGSGRILPECFDDDESLMEPTKKVDHDYGAHHEDDGCLMKLDLDDIENIETKEFMNRLSMTRSKKPLLETIVEEAK